VLSSANFQTVVSFTSTAIGKINHPERLQYTFGSDTPVQWKSSYTISQIQDQVANSVQDTNLQYSLRDVLATLFTAYQGTVPPLPTSPIGALVFVSDTSSPSNYADADQFAKRLKDAGFTLTFVLLGPNVDSTKLTNYTTNFITWKDLSQPQPDDWDNLSASAYACKFIIHVTQLIFF
ncbi:hypothetical protein FO519_010406, partial [Halicephalobus sp. NKZ332]